MNSFSNNSDPAFLQLEQRVNDAARRIQIANQALQDARRASEAWIDTGTAYLLLYIYLWILMTNVFRSAFEVFCKFLGLGGSAFQIFHESKEGELDVYLIIARILSIGGIVVALIHVLSKHFGYSFSRFYRCICGCTRSRNNRQWQKEISKSDIIITKIVHSFFSRKKNNIIC